MMRQGLCGDFCQINTALSHRAGTLRGMHFQRAPHAEVKLMRCLRGSVYDVVLDLRPDSPTFRRWSGVELSADNGLMLYAPEGTAHGYLTLADDAELSYDQRRVCAGLGRRRAPRRSSVWNRVAAKHLTGIAGGSVLGGLSFALTSAIHDSWE